MTWGLLASFADHDSLPQDPYKHNLHKQFCSPGLKFSCSPCSSKDLEFTTLQLLHLTVLPDFTSQTVLPFSKRSSGAPPPVSFAHPSETSSTACTQPYCPSSRYCCGQRPPWVLGSVIIRLPLVFYGQLYLFHLTNWVICGRQGPCGPPCWSDSCLYWLLSQLFIIHPKVKLHVIWASPLQAAQPCCLTSPRPPQRAYTHAQQHCTHASYPTRPWDCKCMWISSFSDLFPRMCVLLSKHLRQAPGCTTFTGKVQEPPLWHCP